MASHSVVTVPASGSVSVNPGGERGSRTGGRVNVRNVGASSVWLGGDASVLASTGIELKPAETFAEYLDVGEQVFAVADGSPVELRVLRVGR